MRIFNKKILVILLVFFVVGFIMLLVYQYKQGQELKNVAGNLSENKQQNQTSIPISATSTLKTYRNEDWGFEFQYPENWKLEENSFYSPFSKFNLIGVPSEEDFLPNSPFLINIVTPDFIERQFSDLRNITSKITVAKIEGLKYEYKEQKLSYITIVLPFGQYKMILSATKAYENVLNQILTTFKFLK